MELDNLSRDEETMRCGNLIFRVTAQRVLVLASNPVELALTPIEFRLLLHFARHEGQVLSREHLITHIWGGDIHVLDRTIDTHVSNLRRKILHSDYEFRPSYGVGYSFSQKRSGERKNA